MPSSPVESDGGEIRFSWLLQPIRDLTKNWDIDVASLLEKYLTELEKISISFDGGSTSMNFAEAALLIQGSACVYSKKVEYLYALVYQTLDLITRNKRNQQPSSVDNEGKDTDVSLGRTQTETFLELDDIQEAKNIDLKDEEDDLKTAEKNYLIPKTPLALLPTSEMHKRGEDVLVSHTGEIVGSRKDFKMNICTIHHSGALLLDTNCITMLERSLKILYSSTPMTTGMVAPVGHILEQAAQAESREDDMAIDDGYGDDGMDYDPISPPPQVEDSQTTPPRRQLRDRDALKFGNVQPHFEDHWECLNPYDDSKFTSKPFKKGKPYKLPVSSFQLPMETERKRKRSKRTNQQHRKLESLTSFLSNGSFLNIGVLPSNPLRKPIYPEFNSVFWDEYLRRQDINRRERKYLMNKLSEDVYQDLNSVVEDGAEQLEDLAAPEPNNAWSMEPLEGVILIQGEDRFDDWLPYFPKLLNIDDGQEDFSDGSVNADFDFDNQGAASDDVVGKDPLSSQNDNNWDDCVVSSYEDLVRKYVNNCLLEAQQYAQETDISRRVKTWEQKIVPVLKEEESHRPYDIHVYGKEILDTFNDEEMSFKEIVKGKEPFEVCRYFLSSLLMANMQNVEIIQTTALEMDIMKLKLLDKTPAHEKISEYLAPSLQGAGSS